MADIAGYLKDILDAVYGEEVRGSIHDAIDKMNKELEKAVEDSLTAMSFKGDLGVSHNTTNNLNNLLLVEHRGIWRLLGSRTYTNVPSDFVNSKQAYLIVYSYGTDNVMNVSKQELHYFSNEGANASITWSRVFLNDQWYPWHKDIDEDHTLTDRGRLTGSDNINNVLSIGLYYVTNSGGSWKPENWPLTTGGSLLVFRSDTKSPSDPVLRTVQVALGADIRMRYGLSGSTNNWSDWMTFKDYDLFDKKAYLERRLINANDDMDDLLVSGTYRASRGADNWKPVNWPATGGGTALIFGYSGYGEGSSLGTVQIVLAGDITYIRFGTSVESIDWTDWIEYRDYSTIDKKAFLERRLLNGSDDMDSIIVAGSYRVSRGTDNWQPAHWPATGGGTVLVFRYSGYGDDSNLGTAQIVLAGDISYIRFGTSVGSIGWTDWTEYKEWHSVIKSVAEEFDTQKKQDLHDYVTNNGDLYECIVESDASESWELGKFRKTTIGDELKKLKATVSVPKHNLDLGYYQFPLTWDKARTSSGDIVVETWSIIDRRILSDYISTDDIDAMKVVEPFFDIGLALYDSNKQWMSNLSISLAQINTIQGEKLIFLPRKVGYVRICLVYEPDEYPNAFDISSVIKEHFYGIKFMLNTRFDTKTGSLRTKMPLGIGNYVGSGFETYDYFQYRLRSGFFKTADYSAIYISNDEDYSYTVNVKYMNDSLEVVSSVSYADVNKIDLNSGYPYFAIQAYNTVDPNTTPLSPSHAIMHIELANDAGGSAGIVGLNNEKEMSVKLQQISTNYAATSDLSPQPLTMIHFSDLHANASALSNIVEFSDYYSDYIVDVVHTGDTINSIQQQFSFSNVTGAGKFLNGLGNHDTWDSTGSTSEDWRALSEADSYDRFIAPFKSEWGSNLHITNGKCYYYKDYPDNNVRFIMLDCMHETQEQLTWFTNTLASARTAGLHVLIGNHVKMANSEDLHYLNSGFDNPVFPRTYTPVHPFPNITDPEYITAVDNFVTAGGIVVAWLCGHMHCDTLATYHDILNIAVTTAGDVEYTRTYDARVPGTKSYDAFNVVGVDTSRGHLYLVRVGLDYTATMRKIDTLTWNYITHTLVHTS